MVVVVVGVLFRNGFVGLVVVTITVLVPCGVRWAADRRGFVSPRTPDLLACVLELLMFVWVCGGSQSPLSAP